MDLSAVTLTQLRYLATVDRVRSFRVAAEQCHVSQPALSMQIHRLEELLGVSIFDRSCQPIVPTERGSAILEQVRTILREADRLADVVQVQTELAGPYRLGCIPTLAPTLIPLVVPAFLLRHPHVELVVEEAQTEVMLRRLADGTLDGGLAATPLGTPGVKERRLYDEPFHVYLPDGHRLLAMSALRQSDLVDERPWILAEGHCFRQQVLHLCKIDRSALTPRFESGTFETLVGLVDAGLGLTILPELVVHGFSPSRRAQRVRPFVPPIPAREVSFIHVREHLHRGIADALVDAARHAVPLRLVHDAPDIEVVPPAS